MDNKEINNQIKESIIKQINKQIGTTNFIGMSYLARFGEKSTHQKESENIMNLLLFSNHVQKQLTVHQQVFQNYQSKLSLLEQKKNYLLALIQQSLQHNSTSQPIQNPTQQITQKNKLNNLTSQQSSQSFKKLNKQRLKSISQSQRKNVKYSKPKITPSNNKAINIKDNNSLLMNRSRIESKKQTSKQKHKNYLPNINQYKHTDLVQEVTNLTKQLKTLINKTVSKDSTTMGKSLIMEDKSLIMENKSLMKENKSQKIDNRSFMMQNNSLLMESKFPLKKGQSIDEIQQEQFMKKYLCELGCIQRVPTINVNDQMDEVLSSLIVNLQKQQSVLIKKIFKYKNLQIKRITKQHLQQKTIQNMRIIYNLNKQKQSQTQHKQLKSTKDLIKFGYTDQMLQSIQQKNYKTHQIT